MYHNKNRDGEQLVLTEERNGRHLFSAARETQLSSREMKRLRKDSYAVAYGQTSTNSRQTKKDLKGIMSQRKESEQEDLTRSGG